MAITSITQQHAAAKSRRYTRRPDGRAAKPTPAAELRPGAKAEARAEVEREKRETAILYRDARPFSIFKCE